jgi:hypothetical protein
MQIMGRSQVMDVQSLSCTSINLTCVPHERFYKMCCKKSWRSCIMHNHKLRDSTAIGIRCYAGQAAERRSLPEEPTLDWPKYV